MGFLWFSHSSSPFSIVFVTNPCICCEFTMHICTALPLRSTDTAEAQSHLRAEANALGAVAISRIPSSGWWTCMTDPLIIQHNYGTPPFNGKKSLFRWSCPTLMFEIPEGMMLYRSLPWFVRICPRNHEKWYPRLPWQWYTMVGSPAG